MNRWLIVGSGDVAERMVALTARRQVWYALCRDTSRAATWRSRGAKSLLGDLDHPDTLSRLSGLAQGVFHFAPPPGEGAGDPRTRHLIAALERGHILPRRLVYISTTGVYGDCAGASIDETRPINPGSDRALRRVDAERQLRDFGRRTGCAVIILRAPGIYALDRLPLNRLSDGLPVPTPDHDPWTNHIHADDLARAAWLAMLRGKPGRIYNAVDDSELTLGGYYRTLAAHFGLPPPPVADWETLKSQLSEIRLSFMQESRKIANIRIKTELVVDWNYPTVASALANSVINSGFGVH